MIRQSITIFMVLLGQGWAGACDPQAPSARFLDAVGKLEAARWEGHPACKGQSEMNCVAYHLPPVQLVELLYTVNQESTGDVQKAMPPQLNGNVWTLTDSVRYGRITRLSAISGGSLARTDDVQTAFEELSGLLQSSSRWSWAWWNCALAGLSTSKRFTASACHWVAATSDWPRTFDFTISSVTDGSLSNDVYSWYPSDGGSCLSGTPFRKSSPY